MSEITDSRFWSPAKHSGDARFHVHIPATPFANRQLCTDDSSDNSLALIALLEAYGQDPQGILEEIKQFVCPRCAANIWMQQQAIKIKGDPSWHKIAVDAQTQQIVYVPESRWYQIIEPAPPDKRADPSTDEVI